SAVAPLAVPQRGIPCGDRALLGRDQLLFKLSRITRMMLQSAALGLGAYLVIRQKVMPGAMIASSIMMARALAPIEPAIANWRTFVLVRDRLRRLTQSAGLQARAPSRAHLMHLTRRCEPW